ncbi:MAG: hypothetical protein MMC33_003144 [Icmadophila ericetorum]|nr:hypothetical protein [Icmadophila ericetorum]
MLSKHAHYFTSSPDWQTLAPSTSAPPDEELPLTPQAQRDGEAKWAAAWAAQHPTSEYGYGTQVQAIQTRDGASINLKIYEPLHDSVDTNRDKRLPILYVTHGGGWMQGSAVTEEVFFLRELLTHLPRFLVVSVEYRLAPENPFPIPFNDCWDALLWVVKESEGLGGDSERLYLAGSSAGGSLAAALAVEAHEHFKISGLILNVPVLCHPQHRPPFCENGSYDECVGGLLSGAEMFEIWADPFTAKPIGNDQRLTSGKIADMYVPDKAHGDNWRASPLRADLKKLPPTYVFVAGQDPVRDEGIAFAEAAEKVGARIKMHVYQGVPHTFAEFPELETTKRFNVDMLAAFTDLLDEAQTQQTQQRSGS